MKPKQPQKDDNFKLSLPFQQFHFSLHKCFSPDTFAENFGKYQFFTRYFHKFRVTEIPSWSIWSGKEAPRLLHHSAGLWRAPSAWKPADPWSKVSCLNRTVLSNSSNTQAWGPQSERCFHTVLRGEKRARIHSIYPACLKHMWNQSGSYCSINIIWSGLIYCYLLMADSKASSPDGCICGHIQFKYKRRFLMFFECYR